MSNIQVPPELNEIIVQRQKAWAEYDKQQGNAAKLRDLANAVPNSSSPIPIDNLTAETSPPRELTAAVVALEEELAGINRLRQAIANREDQIKQIETHARNMTIGVIAIVLFVLLIAVAMIF